MGQALCLRRAPSPPARPPHNWSIRMKVLHLDSGREMRGGQWQVLRLLEGLRRENVGGTLLTPRASPLWIRRARSAWMCGHSVHGRSTASLANRIWSTRTMPVLTRWPPFALARRWWSPGVSISHTVALEIPACQPVCGGVTICPARNDRGWRIRRQDIGDLRWSLCERGGRPSGTPADTVVAPATGDPRKGTALALDATRRAGAWI